MTDIREKVAREIWHSFHAETMDTDGKAEALLMADAALSACRYQEMRQALEGMLVEFEREFGDGKGEPDDASVFAGEDGTPTITYGSMRRARAALGEGKG